MCRLPQVRIENIVAIFVLLSTLAYPLWNTIELAYMDSSRSQPWGIAALVFLWVGIFSKAFTLRRLFRQWLMNAGLLTSASFLATGWDDFTMSHRAAALFQLFYFWFGFGMILIPAVIVGVMVDSCRFCRARERPVLPPSKLYMELNVEGTQNCEDCAICFESFLARDACCQLSCKHVFHHACISRWAAVSASCPCCRSSVAQQIQEANNVQADVQVVVE